MRKFIKSISILTLILFSVGCANMQRSIKSEQFATISKSKQPIVLISCTTKYERDIVSNQMVKPFFSVYLDEITKEGKEGQTHTLRERIEYNGIKTYAYRLKAGKYNIYSINIYGLNSYKKDYPIELENGKIYYLGNFSYSIRSPRDASLRIRENFEEDYSNLVKDGINLPKDKIIKFDSIIKG